MTDAELIHKKLAYIETSIAELRSLAHLEDLERDVRERRFVEHTLQVMVQAALDIASHITSDERLGEPTSNRHMFVLLARHSWIPPELSRPLELMAGFRNILVHGYAEVDVGILRDICQRHLTDVEAFVTAIRARLQGE